ncbi:hypothetical protein [Ahrensia marina]|uniref:Uncharacterized protein n=1 Tax=Ahrensia marina TaxID=1514904 RepID=A0A0N0VLI4_9HYPH|nr:hypothetical protein [Ahrensia marina]KPB00681.1 hypothetical protein SU32_12770 [Ahrensia marina]
MDRTNSQASIYAHTMREFKEKVVAPAISQLELIPHEMVGGKKKHLIQITRDNSHNSLCYEMRLGFALIIGATFERGLRFWVSIDEPRLRSEIEMSSRAKLNEYVGNLKGSKVAAMLETDDLRELWELVSSARHGNGPATKRLQTPNPSLWQHLDSMAKPIYDDLGLTAYSIRVHDGDIERYFHSTINFWESVSGR